MVTKQPKMRFKVEKTQIPKYNKEEGLGRNKSSKVVAKKKADSPSAKKKVKR